MTAKLKLPERKSLSEIVLNNNKNKVAEIPTKRSNTSIRITVPAKSAAKAGNESRITGYKRNHGKRPLRENLLLFKIFLFKTSRL